MARTAKITKEELLEHIKKDNVKALQLAISQGIKLNSHHDHEYPITAAAKHNALKCLAVLLEQNVSLTVKDIDEHTPLLAATSQGHEEAALMLIGKGANIHARSHTNAYILHHAAEHNMIKVAKIALANRCHVNAVTDYNFKDKFTALHLSAIFGNHEITRRLLANDADIEYRDKEQRTAMHHAAQNGWVEVIRVLHSYKADINSVSNSPNSYTTPLLEAIGAGKAQAVDELLALGADVNYITMNGETAICTAAKSQPEILQSIIDHGANLEPERSAQEMKKRKPGNPLERAINQFQPLNAYMLIVAGAKIEIPGVTDILELIETRYNLAKKLGTVSEETELEFETLVSQIKSMHKKNKTSIANNQKSPGSAIIDTTANLLSPLSISSSAVLGA